VKRAGLAAALVVLAATTWYLVPVDRPPPLPSPELCLSVLDVGQGDALLLSFSKERHWLIDGGGVQGGSYDVGARRLLPMLRRLGIEHLDKLFLTHPHADHFEGLFAVLESLTVDEMWLPTVDGLEPRARALVQLARRRGLRIREAGRGAELVAEFAPAEAHLLYPWPGWQRDLGRSHADANNSSLVLRVALGKVSFLLTGDIEAPAEALLIDRDPLLRSTVIKAPHHASSTSSTASFVEAVDPLVAVAGIGRDNRFGFPHASVSARYLGRGTPLMWTGRHGHMRLCTSGYSLRMERLNERGSASLLREWDVEEISEWSRGSEPMPQGRVRHSGVVPVRLGESNSAKVTDYTMVKPHKKCRKRRKRRKTRKPGVITSPASPTAPDPEKVRLIDDREWQRRRKDRRRLKAPWR
jgi:beta-lactamase superfamily II metal-dependent hydrolase